MGDEQYRVGDDGLPVEVVGDWAKDKHKILTDYVQASGAARRKFLSNSAFIDVFCGPGRLQLRRTGEYIDGSPVAAHKQSLKSLAPFTSIEISDAPPDLVEAAYSRLEAIGAPIHVSPGPALSAIKEIVARVPARGLHFAFLDPHNLGTLSFGLFEALAKLQYIDVIAHVSLSDLRRNVGRYSSEEYEQFDEFAPGWRSEVSLDSNLQSMRSAIVRYWTRQVEGLGLPPAKHCELIAAPGGQQLYWLFFISRSDFARGLWNKISSIAKAPKLL